MSFLLKIVQGPNAGAEIALAEGVNLTFGSADDCDIILSDSSVPGHAFELEVTGERVVAVMNGGKDVKLEPYHVTMIGTSAVVVGPQEGTWKSLVWPKEEKPEETAVEDDGETAPAEETQETKRRSSGCFLAFLFVLLFASAAGFAYWKYPDRTKEYAVKTFAFAKSVWTRTAGKVKAVKSPSPVAVPKESLDAVAADCGFSVKTEGGKTVARGDFKTRVGRLEATARAYAAQPGVKVDFTDGESLASAVSELLVLVTDGNIRLEKIKGRKAFLSGCAPSRGSLEKTIRSLGEDVPKIEGVDCSRVVVGGVVPDAGSRKDANSKDTVRNGVAAVEYKVPKMKETGRDADASRKAEPPRMPVAGILTVPYPCLVLSDGTRAMEGARFGGYVIEKIEADRVTVRGAGGSFEWRP